MDAKYAQAPKVKPAAPRLLVIDDDQLMRKLLARVLAAKGYETTLAQNAYPVL